MTELQVIEHKRQRVLTTTQIAEHYETDARRISGNYNANKMRYQEGKHFYFIEGEDLKNFRDLYGNSVQVDRAPKLYLWTERGAFLHAKSLNTDKAWETYDMLIETYFRAKEFLRHQQQNPQWQATRFQSKLTRNAETAVIKLFVQYAKDNGSKNPELYYKHFSGLVNAAVGIDSRQRDCATAKVLSVIDMLEDLIVHTIPPQMQAGIYYKDIYKNCKVKVMEAMQYVYLPEGKLLSAAS